MSISYIPEQKPYKKLTPFKRFVLQSFPWINEDFDALTNNELLAKVIEYLNSVIANEENVEFNVNELYDAFVELYNYFNNLDVQEEINNKLDAMVLDGTMGEIINQEIFGDLNTRVTNLERNALYIGNSYTDGVGATSSEGLFNTTKKLFNKAYKKTSGGIGFLQYTNHTDTFLTMLTNAINDTNIDNNEITDIIIIGAWGDTRALHESTNYATYSDNLQNAIISFVNTAKNNFPNIKRISYVLAESRQNKILDSSSLFDDAFWINKRMESLLPKNGIEYLGWIGFNLMLNSNYFSNDGYHPNSLGYQFLSSLFISAYDASFKYAPLKFSWANRACNITDGTQLQGYIVLTPDEAEMTIQNITLASGNTPAHGTKIELFNFANNMNFSLPMPTATESEKNINNGFTCTTQFASANDFSFNNNYNGKLSIKRNPNEPNSTIIYCQTLGNSKTITNSPSTLSFPSKISWKI